ncbi:MAG: choice-of-anchor J domain-containing protein, partial [Muribaculaceae bacterium]|nr:choice-of-anchor J domain-containing protein [Muribaculaceae bacterium]
MKRNLTFLITILSVLFVTAQNANTVFSYDFTTTNELKEWIVIDNNGDGYTWQSLPGLKGATYNGNTTSEAGDDWLISPAFDVEAGKHYIIEYTLAQRGSFGEDIVNIHYGAEVTPSSQATLLVTEKYSNHAGMVTRR